MADVIDVHDLTDEDVRFIKKIVELLREKAKIKEARVEKAEREEIDFTAHPSDVIGEITRREIYDYL